MKKVLITGITGQDGLFLTNKLIETYKGVEIIGITRQRNSYSFFRNLERFKISNKNIKLLNLNLSNPEAVDKLIYEFVPDAVFNLSGPSSVYESIQNPKQAEEILSIFKNITNSLIKHKNFCKFYQASSSEMFGNTITKLNENSIFLPNSPYAEAKLKNHKSCKFLREKYDWEIFSGIMFNHESEFRSNNFLIMKIINGALKIKSKDADKLIIGSLELIRDWSYAKDTIEGVHSLITEGKEFDYIIASGKSYKIEDIVDIVFSYLNLNWKNYVEVDQAILRDGDSSHRIANIEKITNHTSWRPETTVEEMLEIMITKKI